MTNSSVVGKTRSPAEIVVLAAIAQNCALGLSFGSYGALMPSFASEFGASRGLAASGIAVLVLSLSLLSMIVGPRIGRLSLRSVMMTGAIVHAVGYALLAAVTDMYQAILVYGLLIGPGACLLGVLPASTLVGNWITEGRGKALGIVNLPIFLLLTPVVTARLVSRFDMTVVFASLSVVLLICAALMSRVVGHPPQSPINAGGANGAPKPLMAITSREVLTSRPFWLLSLGVGAVAGGGTALTAHLVPLAMARGFSLENGAWLMSAYATAGIGGVLIFGWIADRFGYRAGLLLNGGVQVCFWLILMLSANFPLMLLAAIAIGLCSTAILALHGAAIASIFGPQNIGAVLGLSYLPKLPFIFGASPLMGALFDVTGAYEISLFVQVIILGAVIVGFFLLPGSSGEGQVRRNAAS